jgi:hypothetical protein
MLLVLVVCGVIARCSCRRRQSPESARRRTWWSGSRRVRDQGAEGSAPARRSNRGSALADHAGVDGLIFGATVLAGRHRAPRDQFGDRAVGGWEITCSARGHLRGKRVSGLPVPRRRSGRRRHRAAGRQAEQLARGALGIAGPFRGTALTRWRGFAVVLDFTSSERRAKTIREVVRPVAGEARSGEQTSQATDAHTRNGGKR